MDFKRTAQAVTVLLEGCPKLIEVPVWHCKKLLRSGMACLSSNGAALCILGSGPTAGNSMRLNE